MPIKISTQEIQIKANQDEFIFSVLNPEYPIFRIHTERTTINISSSFYEHKDRCILPRHCLAFNITETVARKLIMDWTAGTQFKRYGQFKHYESILLELQNNGLAIEVNNVPSLDRMNSNYIGHGQD